jgi:hypothetical protein
VKNPRPQNYAAPRRNSTEKVHKVYMLDHLMIIRVPLGLRLWYHYLNQFAPNGEHHGDSF